VRAENGDKPGWGLTDSLIADLWALVLNLLSGEKGFTDHPLRAEMTARAAAAQQAARAVEQRSRYQRAKARIRARISHITGGDA